MTPIPRTAHPYLMWDALQEGPNAVDRTLHILEADGLAQRAAAHLTDGSAVTATGCGSSLYAAGIAALALEQAAGVPAQARQAFELATFPPPLRGVILGISHTGATPDVLRAVELWTARGFPALGITDVADSPLATAVSIALLGAGEEETALPKTRSYLTTVARGLALAAAAAGTPQLGSALAAAPGQMAQVLDQIAGLTAQLADRWQNVERVIVIGGGAESHSAQEGALKVIETARVHAVAWELEEAGHGTWASVRRGDLLIVLAPEGRCMPHLERVARGLAQLGQPLWVIGASSAARSADSHGAEVVHTALPTDVHELVAPLLTVLPLYAFAYHLALRLGRDPDRMGTHLPHAAAARSILRRRLPDSMPT